MNLRKQQTQALSQQKQGLNINTKTYELYFLSEHNFREHKYIKEQHALHIYYNFISFGAVFAVRLKVLFKIGIF